MKITTAKKPRMENKKKKEAMKLYKKDFDYLQDQYENDNRGIVILNCGNIVNSLKKALFDIETRNGNPHDFQEVFFLKTRKSRTDIVLISKNENWMKLADYRLSNEHIVWVSDYAKFHATEHI